MRTLAQRLDSGTATLYRHFGNRAELVAHVVDRIIGEVPLETETLSAVGWQEACRTIAQSMFGVLRRHKNVAPLLMDHVPLGPTSLVRRECCLAALLGSGFPPPLAARAYATLARYVLGFALQLDRGSAGHRRDAHLSAVFHDLDKSRFPATVAVAKSLPVPLEDEFAFGLELILEGLAELHDR